MIREIFKNQIQISAYTVLQNIDGIVHEESLTSAPAGGNSVNWVLGHIVDSRGGMLELLGGERLPIEGLAEVYKRGSSAIGPGADCIKIEYLKDAFATYQDSLTERLDAVDVSWFAQECAGLFDPELKTTQAEKLSTLVFHECYHAGQLGVIRRAIGRDGKIQ
ncbi:MAG: putative damage-inducible protein DinB [Planctomycetota bacterium]|jgi:uncharacterized damage-inducible protein DinB